MAEKGPQAACMQDGLEAFFEGDFDKALLLYLKAAEMGMELGQANAAWMLSSWVRLPAAPHCLF